MAQAYKEILIPTADAQQQDMLVALLSYLDYDSFLQEDQQLKAYILAHQFNEQELLHITTLLQVQYTICDLEQKNWNEEWEKNYEPVIVNSKVAVRAHFHPHISASECNIIITPQMSFGTGHHSTTKLVLDILSNLPLASATVLDYGCGTGVLGIYAALQGAQGVVLCDIDEGCVQNTLTNIELNAAQNCTVLCGNISDCSTAPVDVLIANINLNILTDNMQAMASRLQQAGHLVLSGFFAADVAILEFYGKKHGLEISCAYNENTWSALHMIKK